MAGPLPMRFLRSYSDVDDLPHVHAEVAVMGRSNVGKSSLINALAQRKGLAKTSKTPGATRLLNAFEVGREDSGRWLMDLPGYGYAKVSKAEQRRWADMLGTYVEERENLVAVLLLIDGEVGPTALDLQTVEWLEHLGRPVRYVATKADKVKAAKRQKRRTELTSKLGVARADVLWVAAEKGQGLPELRSLVRELLGVPP
ncbi:MAG: ribosome biogenesis GTP-binding protein YsxC [Actinobacteria bacterium]|nr:ribosome biogenesis GTP-binding protein YsxC [Actinomycetota bacterium]NIS31131.1 ribosome biogenesis GTP-binding protein YsxC [Actinomycetota bacterium]NIT95489.1 ribosome biogenesis GTP-binding protein YsxC [Actinomycetota bacterium]NIU19185.1 ribosome biogenesis GTP-binding protein YsxC [Actinomycetota bacterium]NIU66279.1 ribosome biogenesis GTP-binding protein YsxC [Actinomycetota bacterium]